MILPKAQKLEILIREIPVLINLIENENEEKEFVTRCLRTLENIIKNNNFSQKSTLDRFRGVTQVQGRNFQSKQFSVLLYCAGRSTGRTLIEALLIIRSVLTGLE